MPYCLFIWQSKCSDRNTWSTAGRISVPWWEATPLILAGTWSTISADSCLWDPTGSGSSISVGTFQLPYVYRYDPQKIVSIIGCEFCIHLNCFTQTFVAMRVWTRVIRVRSHPTCNRGMTFVLATSRLLAISSYLLFLNSSLIIFYLMFWIWMDSWICRYVFFIVGYIFVGILEKSITPPCPDPL